MKRTSPSLIKAMAKRAGRKVIVRHPVPESVIDNVGEIRLIDDLSVSSPGGPVITADTPPDQWDPLTKAYAILAAKGGAL